MKRKIISLIICLGCFINLQSQSIIYNFYTGKEEQYLKSVKEGTKVTFTITNINRNVYKVGIKGEIINYWTEVPAIFSSIKIPDAIAQISPSGAAKVTPIAKPYNDFRESVKKIQSCKNLLNNLNTLVMDGYSQYNSINENKTEFLKNFTKDSNENHQYASLKILLDKYFDDALNKYDTLLTVYHNWGVDELIKGAEKTRDERVSKLNDLEKVEHKTPATNESINHMKKLIAEAEYSIEEFKSYKALLST